jgi:hypothetical protein
MVSRVIKVYALIFRDFGPGSHDHGTQQLRTFVPAFYSDQHSILCVSIRMQPQSFRHTINEACDRSESRGARVLLMSEPSWAQIRGVHASESYRNGTRIVKSSQ